MTTYYVGPGGNDGNDGLSWANRFLTLNGAEDEPVAANDTVYVGPGTYRETLTCDIDGSAGNIITFIGDISGENTDGIGGIVRITGLDTDDDITPTRTVCINLNGKDYRTFRGFYFEGKADWSNGYVGSSATTCDNIIIEDCVFGSNGTSDGTGSLNGSISLDFSSAAQTNWKIRRCIFMHGAPTLEHNYIDGDRDTIASVIENCVFMGDQRSSNGSVTRTGINSIRAYNYTIQHCYFHNHEHAVRSINVTNQNFVYDNVFQDCRYDLFATTARITAATNSQDNVNTKFGEGADDYRLWWEPHILKAGFVLPYNQFLHANWLPNLLHASDTSNLTEDLFGIERSPNTKATRGAIAFRGIERDTTTVRTGTSSIKLYDAGRHVVPIIVRGGDKYRIRVYVNRETNYAGTNPEIQIKRPGKADIIVTDTGSVSTWNQLSYVITTDSDDKWLHLELVSQNTASSGDFAVYFDDLSIKPIGGKEINHKWLTAEIVQFWLSKVSPLDVWITATIPVSGTGPERPVSPLPVFYRQP
jgi:hypothetical protein